jgi:hypothetical protein
MSGVIVVPDAHGPHGGGEQSASFVHVIDADDAFFTHFPAWQAGAKTAHGSFAQGWSHGSTCIDFEATHPLQSHVERI